MLLARKKYILVYRFDFGDFCRIFAPKKNKGHL